MTRRRTRLLRPSSLRLLPLVLLLAPSLIAATPNGAPARELALALGGDVMLGRDSQHGWRAHGGAQPFGAFAEALRRADLAFINLEMGVCATARAPSNVPLLWAPPGRLDALRDAGIDAVSVANNHALDCGPRGLDATLAELAGRGIAAVGVAPSGTARLGPDVLLVGATFTPPPYRALGARALVLQRPTRPEGPVGSVSELVARVAALRRRQPDSLLLVSLHWGRERAPEPAAWQRRLGRQLVDAGANVIAGHGSHTRQLVERYRDAVIAYGLGNLVFDDSTELGRPRPPLLVRFRRGPEGWRALGDGVLDAR
ncbi:MAG TPA: CapA family protein [Polyangiaceae bacterium]|nr:CapA family protein [Polyangiaceae bacterium]